MVDFVSPMLTGYRWGNGPAGLTYSTWDYDGTPRWDSYSETRLRAAFDKWSAVANVTFTQVYGGESFFRNPSHLSVGLTGNDLDFVFGEPGADWIAGMAVFPDPGWGDMFLAHLDQLSPYDIDRGAYPHPEGDIFLDHFSTSYRYVDDGGKGFSVVLHEIGHALGLKHPHNESAGHPTFTSAGLSSYDTDLWTVMSYNDSSPYYSRGNPATPMPLDILAAQALYGANMGHRTGDDTYRAGSDGVVRTLWDAGGTDTLDASSLLGAGATLSLVAGATSAHGSDSKTAIAFGVTIENAIGSDSNDRITGNDAANTLTGRRGDDGMTGGSGNDVIYGNQGLDDIDGGDGDDRLFGGQNGGLPGRDGIMRAGTERIVAGAGNDLAYGNMGSDQMFGGTGNDTMYGGQDNDVLFGEAGRDALLGNAGDDYLEGHEGEDVLWGGAGADVLKGGDGADTFYVDALDRILDQEAIDIVFIVGVDTQPLIPMV